MIATSSPITNSCWTDFVIATFFDCLCNGVIEDHYKPIFVYVLIFSLEIVSKEIGKRRARSLCIMWNVPILALIHLISDSEKIS